MTPTPAPIFPPVNRTPLSDSPLRPPVAWATRPCLLFLHSPSSIFHPRFLSLVPLSSFILHPSSFALAATNSLGNPALQSPLHPAGPLADRVYHLWWLYLTICIVVFLLVVAVALISPIKNRHGDYTPQTTPDPAQEQRLTLAVGTAVLVTVVLLFVMLVGDYATGRATHQFGQSPNPVTIHLIAHQWWWEATYTDAHPQNVFTTANELHVPVGRPVKIDLDAADVIHSFWAPNLVGKKDLVPGHPNTIYLQADKPGTYWGQCAEFCGFQHAKMRFSIIAEPQDQFDKWLAASRTLSAEPTTDSQRHGRQVFLGYTCVMCHTIAGTPAGGRVGPDLTHLASRQTLAAGTLPNTKGNLGGWILDPQHIKPGARMPRHNLTGNDLQSLLDYLESLK